MSRRHAPHLADEPSGLPPAAVAPVGGPAAGRDVSVLDTFLVLARHAKLILLCTVGATALGVFIALSTPREYVAHAVVVPEQPPEDAGLGGSALALRSFGIDLEGAGANISTSAYPDVIQSFGVRSGLIYETFRLSTGERVVLGEYLAEKAGPMVAIRRALRLGRREPAALVLPDSVGTDSVLVYSLDDLDAMEELGEMITVDDDIDSGLMTVTVGATDPLLAAALVDRLVDRLTERIQAITTGKARADLAFARRREGQAQADLNRARSALARWDDQNLGATSARLLAQRDQLRQEFAFATEIYSQLQTRTANAEQKVQQDTPVVTILDPPVVPARPSRPSRRGIVTAAFLVGLVLGVGGAFLLEGLAAAGRTPSGRQTRADIRRALVPRFLRRRAAVAGAAEASPLHGDGAEPYGGPYADAPFDAPPYSVPGPPPALPSPSDPSTP